MSCFTPPFIAEQQLWPKPKHHSFQSPMRRFCDPCAACHHPWCAGVAKTVKKPPSLQKSLSKQTPVPPLSQRIAAGKANVGYSYFLYQCHHKIPSRNLWWATLAHVINHIHLATTPYVHTAWPFLSLCQHEEPAADTGGHFASSLPHSCAYHSDHHPSLPTDRALDDVSIIISKRKCHPSDNLTTLVQQLLLPTYTQENAARQTILGSSCVAARPGQSNSKNGSSHIPVDPVPASPQTPKLAPIRF